MTPFHAMSRDERADVLREASVQLGMRPLFIEKDYWVCMVLDILFSHPVLAPHLCFRGGTSLSKVFGTIQRFSEDIDVELSPSCFPDVTPDDLPQPGDGTGKSDSKQKRMRKRYRALIRDSLIPYMEKAFLQRGVPGVRVEAEELDKARDPYVVYFRYPLTMQESSVGYVSAHVKLEICGRADAHPSVDGSLEPYLGVVFPDFQNHVSVRAVIPQRTLWEKAFILHETNTRAANEPDSPIRERLARHYYDLDALISSGCYDEGLFREVADKRSLAYKYKWVDYDSLTPASMNIIPLSDSRFLEWERDYNNMASMLRHEPEPFRVIVQRISLFWNGLAGGLE